MFDFVDELFKNGFHDTEITSIEIDGLTVTLRFAKGAYLLDESGKETALSKPCRYVIGLDKRFCRDADSVIDVEAVNRRANRYLDIVDISSAHLGVQDVFFSPFNNTILIDASLEEDRLLIKIENVYSLNCIYE